MTPLQKTKAKAKVDRETFAYLKKMASQFLTLVVKPEMAQAKTQEREHNEILCAIRGLFVTPRTKAVRTKTVRRKTVTATATATVTTPATVNPTCNAAASAASFMEEIICGAEQIIAQENAAACHASAASFLEEIICGAEQILAQENAASATLEIFTAEEQFYADIAVVIEEATVESSEIDDIIVRGKKTVAQKKKIRSLLIQEKLDTKFQANGFIKEYGADGSFVQYSRPMAVAFQRIFQETIEYVSRDDLFANLYGVTGREHMEMNEAIHAEITQKKNALIRAAAAFQKQMDVLQNVKLSHEVTLGGHIIARNTLPELIEQVIEYIRRYQGNETARERAERN